jgi:hypothetical protein
VITSNTTGADEASDDNNVDDIPLLLGPNGHTIGKKAEPAYESPAPRRQSAPGDIAAVHHESGDSDFVRGCSIAAEGRVIGGKAIFDSGATRTLIASEKAEAIHAVIEKTDIRLETANKQQLDVIGETTVRVSFQDSSGEHRTLTVRALVVNGPLQYDIILGVDQLWGRDDGQNLTITPDRARPGHVLLFFGSPASIRLSRTPTRHFAPTVTTVAAQGPPPLEAVLARATAQVVAQAASAPLHPSPMGIKTAPSHAQRVLSAVLNKETEHWIVVVYIDDVLIGAVDNDALVQAWAWVLTQCAAHEITISAPKTSLGAHEIEALGAVVAYQSIRPMQKRLEAIRNYPLPQTVTQLRTWLGMLNQISANVDLGTLLHPLHDAASTTFAKNQQIEWTAQMRTNFHEVSNRLADVRALVPFDAERQVYLITDASDTGCGGLLAHLDGPSNRIDVIDAFSHRFTDAELNYPTVEQEAVAIRVAVRRWRPYLCGRKTIVACDNQSVVDLLQNAATSPNARLRTTASELSEFDLYYAHVAGAKNYSADALSRLPIAPQAGHVLAISEVMLAPPGGDATAELAKLCDAQRLDPGLAHLRSLVEDPQLAQPRSISKSAWHELKLLDPRIVDSPSSQTGALTVLFQGRRCLVVPDGWRTRVLRSTHLPAHIGGEMTLRLLCASFWWPNMVAEARQALAACAICNRVDARRKANAGHSGDVDSAGGPARGGHWQLDTFFCGTPLNNNTRVLVALEEFSNAQFSKVVADSTAAQTLAAFHDLIVRPFGWPRVISIDNGTEFDGDFLRELMTAGVRIVRGLPDHHGLGSRIERSNRERGDRLAKSLLEAGNIAPRNNLETQSWLDAIDAAANAVPLPELGGLTPHELLTGQQRRTSVGLSLPTDLLNAIDMSEANAAHDWASTLRMQQAAFALVAEDRHQMRRKVRAKQDLAAGPPRHTFNVGDLVWTRLPHKLRDGADKINTRLEYSGVFRITNIDPTRLRATLRLLAPLPRYTPLNDNDASPVELDPTITVHFNDMLPFVEGKPIDSDAQLAPFHVLSPAVAFFNSHSYDPTASQDPLTASNNAIIGAINSMLSSMQSQIASATLNKAIDNVKAKRESMRLLAIETEQREQRAAAHRAALAAHAAREEEQRQHNQNSKPEIPRPLDEPPFTKITNVTGDSVTGRFFLYRGRRYNDGIERTRSTAQLTRGELYLVKQWLAQNKTS